MNGKVSLIITTYNRGPLLEKSLERLRHCTIPDEVLVVDDGSDRGSDSTEWVCKGFSNFLPIRYIYNNNPGVSICSFARNIGIKQAIGDIIITSEPELLWVTDIIPQMLKKREKNPNHIISVGTIYHMQEHARLKDIVFAHPKEFLEESIVEDYEIQPRPYNQEGFCKTVNMQATFCALYERAWIEEVGGWDEEMPGNYGFDDIDLCTRLRVSGYNQIIDSDMEAIHQWHPHQPPHLMGQNAHLNDLYFANKNIQDKNSPFVVANKNHEWGIIKQ